MRRWQKGEQVHYALQRPAESRYDIGMVLAHGTQVPASVRATMMVQEDARVPCPRLSRISSVLVVAGAVAIFPLSSCKQPRPAPTASPTASTLVTPSAPAPPAPSPPPPRAQSLDAEAAAELIVGSKRGLEAWRRDGCGKRLVSPGPALHPRWLDSSSVIALRADDNDLATGGRIERISLSDGKRTKVALLPPFRCGPSPNAGPDAGADEPIALALWAESDFVVDPAAQRASLTIMDRNLNMSGVTVDIRVDLTTGKVERWLSDGNDGWCGVPAGVNVGKAPDAIRGKMSLPAATAATFRFAFRDEAIVDLTVHGKPGLRVAGYATESTSPSGRWTVLGGDVIEADYIYRRLLMLDCSTGDLFPIRRRPAAWPAALPRPPAVAGKPSPKLKSLGSTINVIAETDARWVGTSAASELLVIDELIVRPGARSFSVKGQVAR